MACPMYIGVVVHGAHNNDLGIGHNMIRVYVFQQHESVRPWHNYVQQNDIGGSGFYYLYRLCGIVRYPYNFYGFDF